MGSGTKVGPTGDGNSSGSSGSDGSNGSDPDKYCKPVFGYGSPDDDYIWIVSGLFLSIYYIDHLLDTPQLPDNLSPDKQIYYDLSGKALQQQPSAPGIYIKANQNANVKAEKIIIH